MSPDELAKAILAASGPKPQPVELDGIGTVYVRVMTAYDADRMRKQLDTLPKDDGCYVGRMLAFVMCSESGQQLFDAADAETVLKLSKLPPKAQQKVMQAANQAQGTDAGNA